jgi:hypothetical protein
VAHPRGYPEAHDSPAHIAPALELRRAIEAAQRGHVEDAVAYTLAFPIVERTRPYIDDDTNPEVPVHPVGDEPDTVQDMPAVDPERTLERDPYRDGEQTLQASEKELLQRSLQSIGPIDDVSTSANRVLLARARAIRFRLALLDIWPEDFSVPRASEDSLELAIHPLAIVGLGDEEGAVRAIAEDVRGRLPGVNRNTLRDAGAACFARITLLGVPKAIEYVKTRFAELPGAERRAALAAAARLAGETDALRQLREVLS